MFTVILYFPIPIFILLFLKLESIIASFSSLAVITCPDISKFFSMIDADFESSHVNNVTAIPSLSPALPVLPIL